MDKNMQVPLFLPPSSLPSLSTRRSWKLPGMTAAAVGKRPFSSSFLLLSYQKQGKEGESHLPFFFLMVARLKDLTELPNKAGQISATSPFPPFPNSNIND